MDSRLVPVQKLFTALFVPLAFAYGDYAKGALLFSMTQKEIYDAYLLSPHWRDLREAAFNRANGKCEVCACKARHGHHLFYRNPLNLCTTEDIMALCARCHDVWHDWLKQMGKQVRDFCRQSTRGGILALLNPLRIASLPARERPAYIPINDGKRLSKKEEKKLKRAAKLKLKIERHSAQAILDIPATIAAAMVNTSSTNTMKEKSERRANRQGKYEFLMKDFAFKVSLETLPREQFKKFLRGWAVSKYEAFGGGWNSLLSTAIAMYDRERKTPKNHKPLPVKQEPSEHPFLKI